MTAFVSRDDTNLGVGRIFTSPTAYALYENLFAFAEKASGAPVLANGYVVEAMIGSGAVTATKLSSGLVASQIALIAHGAVGAHCFCYDETATNDTGLPGATRSGSSLKPAGLSGNSSFPLVTYTVLSGTWRRLGYSPYTTSNSVKYATLYVRIS